jgi:hypothetical protein
MALASDATAARGVVIMRGRGEALMTGPERRVVGLARYPFKFKLFLPG